MNPAKCRKDNSGYSLVELITVIAIMAVIIGVVSLSVSLIFSRDAQRSAMLIDDALSETRMLSMSKGGVVKMVIHTKTSTDTAYNTIDIVQPGSTKTITIDRGVVISLKGSATSTPGTDITIEFNKSNGSVLKINGESAAANGLYEIESVAKRGSQTAKVILVANTGRHYTEK